MGMMSILVLVLGVPALVLSIVAMVQVNGLKKQLNQPGQQYPQQQYPQQQFPPPGQYGPPPGQFPPR